MATGTTEIFVTEVGFNIDPNNKIFIIDESGRTPALKVSYDDNEYELYICYENTFLKTKYIYQSIILKYFKSNKIDKLLYVETIKMTACDESYVRLADGVVVPPSEALYGSNDYDTVQEEVYDLDGNQVFDENGLPVYNTINIPKVGLKPGYITEAVFYESTVGPTISGAEFTALRRKYNLS